MVLWNFDLLSRVCKKLWYYRKNYGTIPKTMERLTKQKNMVDCQQLKTILTET